MWFFCHLFQWTENGKSVSLTVNCPKSLITITQRIGDCGSISLKSENGLENRIYYSVILSFCPKTHIVLFSLGNVPSIKKIPTKCFEELENLTGKSRSKLMLNKRKWSGDWCYKCWVYGGNTFQVCWIQVKHVQTATHNHNRWQNLDYWSPNINHPLKNNKTARFYGLSTSIIVTENRQ